LTIDVVETEFSRGASGGFRDDLVVARKRNLGLSDGLAVSVGNEAAGAEDVDGLVALLLRARGGAARRKGKEYATDRN
jgi:hypothetical protein